MKILRTVLLLTFFISGFAFSGTVTSVGSGLWSSTTPDAPWPGGTLPLSTDDVIIANGSTVTINQTVTVASLTVGQGTSGVLTFDGTIIRAVTVTNNLTVAAGGTFIVQASGTFTNTLSIGGNLTNGGIFDMTNNTTTTLCNVTFTNTSGNQTVSGAGSTTRFNRITLTKTVLANKVTCSINVSCTSLVPTSGTFEQSAGTFTYTGSGISLSSSSAGLTLSGSGSFTTPNAIANGGTMIVNTSGTLTVGSGNSSLGNTGTMTLTQGTIYVYGRMTMNVGTTTINGANLYLIPHSVPLGTNISNSVSTFDCSGASNPNLTFSSGSVTLVDPNVATIATRTSASRDLKITTAGTVNLTGSNFIFGDGVSTWTGSGTGFLIQSNFPLGNLTVQTGNRAGCDIALSAACTVNGILTLSSGHLTTTSSNLLTLASSAFISGGSAVSYIDGPLAWTMATSGFKLFPIGKILSSDAYRPVTLNVTQGAGTNVYTAEQKEGADPSVSTLANTLNSKSSVRYLNITQTGTASISAADLIMSYSTDDGVGSNNAALRIAHDNGSVFVDLGGAGTAPATGTITSVTNFTTFGDFILAFNTGRTLTLTAFFQGLSNVGGTAMENGTYPISVTVELHNSTSPYALVESKTAVLSNVGVGSFVFTTAANGTPYYIVVKSLNTVATWSGSTVSFTAGALSYDFTSAQAQAYGSNMSKIGSTWCIFSGDVNQDGSVDGLDLGAIDNDNNAFVSGVQATDLNGDGNTDGLDLGIVDNNNNAFVSSVVPSGAPAMKHVRTQAKTVITQ